ncbi:MAG TPA: AAA family ATPase [Candidatus Coprovivens excrementavium]|nr:AAA family ATPase [Candidatus Coprovivens excrementavium]
MNYNEAKEHLTRYLKARIPVIILNTAEKNRALRLIKEVSTSTNMNISLYQMSQGIIDLQTNNRLSEDKTIMSALDYISNEIKHQENVNFVISEISDINESTMVSRYLVDVIDSAEKMSGVIILITNEPVWANIQRLGINIKLNYPTETELQETITKTIEPYKNRLQIEWDETDYRNAATYLQGLSEMEAKNIISSLIVTGTIKKDDLKELKYAKQTLFNEIAGLEAVPIQEDFNIAGLANLKEWLYEKKELMDPIKKEELTKRGIATPKGILLTGVPGCGKSLCSKAVASIFNIPLYRLDLATVQGQYVGQSERQLKEALDTAEYVSPCVLWIDEIEKGLNDNNSSVTSKMIGQFLFWLQECTKPVFVIASANSVDSLPPELIRKGRFDEIFFVDLPNNQERKELLKLYANKYLQVEIGENLLERLTTITDGFASADIEATMRSIAYKLIANKDLTLSENLIINELSKVVSLSKTNPEKINAIRRWGQERATNASR